MVPGLLKRLERNAEFHFVGEEVPIPYEIGQLLNTPLTHLLRNAFDHGLEDEETRLAAGKHPRGLVTLHVFRNSDSILITLTDDGKGLNPEELREFSARE